MRTILAALLTIAVPIGTKDWHTLVNHQSDVPLLSAHATRS